MSSCCTCISWPPCCAVLCCAVLCCAVLCCAVLCCAVLCCAVLCCAVLCCAVLCCAVLCWPPPSLHTAAICVKSRLVPCVAEQDHAKLWRDCEICDKPWHVLVVLCAVRVMEDGGCLQRPDHDSLEPATQSAWGWLWGYSLGQSLPLITVEIRPRKMSSLCGCISSAGNLQCPPPAWCSMLKMFHWKDLVCSDWIN